ncbi:hypothetical protein D3C79_245080 [compost metagenome]
MGFAGSDSDDDDQRGITGKPPGVGVFNLDQRRDPGTKPGPHTTQQQHHHRRTRGGDDNHQADEAADKSTDNAQPAAVANGAGERLATRRKSRTGGHDGGGHRRPARGFQIEMETDKQGKHNREAELESKSQPNKRWAIH